MTDRQQAPEALFSRLYERYGDPTEELHRSYDPWLAEMVGREGSKLESFEFNLDMHPEQSIYVPKVEAQPAYPWLPDSLYYPLFGLKLSRSLGLLSLHRLVDQMRNQPASSNDPIFLPERFNSNLEEGKNTLVVPSHINFQEMGYVRVLRHIVNKDRGHINKRGVVLNNLMKRQKYRGKKLIDHFKTLGNVYFSNPMSASADRHMVPKGASMLANALFTKVLKADLQAGGVELDIALTGSEVKPILDQNGKFSHYLIPKIHPSSAKLVEGFDDALSITLVGPPILDSWRMHISDVLDVQELLKTNSSAEVTDMIYSDITGALENFTRQEVQYSKVSTGVGKSAAAGLLKEQSS